MKGIKAGDKIILIIDEKVAGMQELINKYSTCYDVVGVGICPGCNRGWVEEEGEREVIEEKKKVDINKVFCPKCGDRLFKVTTSAMAPRSYLMCMLCGHILHG